MGLLSSLQNLPVCFLAVLEGKAGENTTGHFDVISLTDGHFPVHTGPGALIFSYKDSIRLEEEPF